MNYDDIYDAQGKKRITPKMSHLPRAQTLAMIQGLVETDGETSPMKLVILNTRSLWLKDSVISASA